MTLAFVLGFGFVCARAQADTPQPTGRLGGVPGLGWSGGLFQSRAPALPAIPPISGPPILVAPISGAPNSGAPSFGGHPARVAWGGQGGDADPARACRRAIAMAERAANIPPHLLAAIARVESGRPDAQGGTSPWPWSINVEGIDHIYETKAAVMAAVLAFQAAGARSIDTGCMQINLKYHPNAFASLSDAFDPVANANYAARFLTELYETTGSWQRATASYHSADPQVGGPYERRVAAVLPDEKNRGDEFGGTLAMAANVVPGMHGPASFGQMSAGLSPGGLGGGVGALMLNNHPSSGRLLPQMGGTAGRGLDAYRSAPVPVASLTSLTAVRHAL